MIFIDEIDSLFRLEFPIDDFLAFICSCYNRRAENLEFSRLTFAFLGVATPYDLICDRHSQSFDIGKAIELTGFTLQETEPLFGGLVDKVGQPERVLKEVLKWTGGQPFLTQKLCQLIQNSERFIEAGNEAQCVTHLVRSKVIQNWECQDEPDHLKHIRDRLTVAEKPYILQLYRQILYQGEIAAENTREHRDLQLSGAIIKTNGKLKIYNRIYAEIFDQNWLAKVCDEYKQPTLRINPSEWLWLEQEMSSVPISLSPTLEIFQSPIDDENLIYDHWLYWVEVDRDSPQKLIDRFHQLFIVGVNYPDQDVESALYRICLFIHGDLKFKYVLNRCCTILRNHWTHNRQNQAIVDLVQLLNEDKDPGTTVLFLSPFSQKLKDFRQLFTQSEEFKQLKRWAAIVEGKTEHKQPLGQSIYRYPCLYPYCLTSENSSPEEQLEVRRLLAQNRSQFELSLWHYVQNLLNPATSDLVLPNPTLLSSAKLKTAINQFVGKVEGSRSYKDLSRLFASQLKTHYSYGEFKSTLYEYLISNIDPRYGKHHFYKKLARQLAETFPESNDQPLDPLLVMKTCRRLFEFLVASPTDENYYLFINLTGYLGITKTMGILLKIALLSHAIKPYLDTNLEKRFAILFKYYEEDDAEKQTWLIEVLENLNIAIATNFSKFDFFQIKNYH